MIPLLRRHPALATTLRRTAKAVVVSVLGSFAYVAGWQLLAWTGFSPLPVLLTTVACVVIGTAVMATGLRLAEIHRPLLGGAYIAVLLVLYGAFFAYTEGHELLAWPIWPAVAAHLAIVYTVQQGGSEPRRSRTTVADVTGR